MFNLAAKILTKNMKDFISNISKKKLVVVLILFLAILARFEYETFNPKFHSDEQYISITTLSLIQGNGLNSSYCDPNDISKSINRPSVDPEAYNLLFAAYLLITHDFYWASTLMNYTSWLILFLAFFIIFKFLKPFLEQEIVFYFLVFICFGYSPYHYYGSPDLWTLNWYVLSFALSLGIFYANRKWIFTILTGTTIAIVYLSRYAYYPLVPLIPSLFLAIGLFFKDRVLMKHSLSIFAIAGLLIFVFSTLKPDQSDYFLQFAHSSVQKKSFFWEHLKQFNFNLALQAFFDEKFFYTLCHSLSIASLLPFFKWTISLSIGGLFIFILFNSLKISWKNKNLTGNFYISMFAIFSALLTILLLLYSSLTRTLETNDTISNWTHVREERYFAPVFFVFTLIVFIAAFHKSFLSQKWLKKASGFLVFLSIGVAAIYYPLNKYSSIKNEPNYFLTGNDRIWLNGLENQNVAQSLNNLIQRSFISGIRPVFLSADRSVNLAEMMGAEYGGSLMDENLENLKTSKSINIIILIGEAEYFPGKNKLVKFVDYHKLSPLVEAFKTKIYWYKLEPQK